MSPTPRRLLSLISLAAIAVAFWCSRILAPAASTGPIGSLCSDLYTSYIPVLTRAAEAIGSGDVPLWNPDQLAGVPVLPSWLQFGAFYPLNALMLVLPVHVALGWTACLHLVIAGAGMYWLARSLDLPPAAARFAAVICMLSQPLAVLPNLFTATTLAPAVLASWVAMAKSPHARTTAIAALLLALQLTTGGNQIVIYTLYAIVLLVPFVIFQHAARTHALRAVTVAALLAAGLVAVLVLPALVSVELSGRATGRLSLAETVPFAPPTLYELGRQLLDPTPGLPRAFYGWTALALAALGLLLPARRRMWFGVVLIALAGVLLVLSTNTPFYELYYRLPTGSWFRVPERAVMLIGIGVALLAAYGVERLQQLGWRRVASLLILLPLVELFYANFNWLPYPQVRSATFFSAPPAVERIRAGIGSQRGYIAMNWQDRFPFMEKLGTWQQVRLAQDYDTLTPAVYGRYFGALLGAEALVDPIFAGRYHPHFGTLMARRALDMLAVKLLIVAPGAQLSWMGKSANAPAGTEPLLIESFSALPRAHIVHRVRSVDSEDDALLQIADPRFNPRTSAVVVSGTEIDLQDDGNSSATIEMMDSDALTLRAHVQQPGLLILHDLMFPGWQAWVDSKPQPIVRANVLFRGIYLEAGDHVVELRYTQPRLGLGMLITGVSLLVLLAMLRPQRARSLGRC